MNNTQTIDSKPGTPLSATPPAVVFTDLDGSLLDHDSYSFAPAAPIIRFLQYRGMPLVAATSKTFAELLPLRRRLANTHPFIVENGAAIYLPTSYFPPGIAADGVARDGFVCHAFCQPRAHWQQLLAELAPDFAGQFVSFQQLGVDGIAKTTGLAPEQAALANQREFSEPVQWLGNQAGKQAFIKALHQKGAHALQGGRFLHISGACNKGEALLWLKTRYQQLSHAPLVSIAIGDSDNDIAMLDAADRALIIRSPAHAPPSLARQDHVLLSNTFGPEGWAQGLQRILHSLNLEAL